MRRARPALSVLLVLALFGVPALSFAAPMASANGEQSGCPDQTAEEADPAAAPPAKAASAKRGAAPSATKARQTAPSYRGGDAPSRNAPRWHRFLPGMYR